MPSGLTCGWTCAGSDGHRNAGVRYQHDQDIIAYLERGHAARGTQGFEGTSLQKQYMLLLTATPVQNNLEELFNLVTLLEPGLLSTAKQFQKQFMDRKDKMTPRNVDQLHKLLAEVMVRNRRSTVGLQFTRRWAKTESVALTCEEAHLYREVTRFVKDHLRGVTRTTHAPGQAPPAGRRGSVLSRIALLSLQMAMGSSGQAAASMLRNMADNERLEAETRNEHSQATRTLRPEHDTTRIAARRQTLARERDLRIAELRAKSTLSIGMRLLNVLVVHQPKLLVRAAVSGSKLHHAALDVVWDPLLEQPNSLAFPGS